MAFKKFDENFLSFSWKWLNDPEIKELTNTPDFTLDAQDKWFQSLKTKDDYKIWGIMVNSSPIGACGLKNITRTDCEYWGYIGEKELWSKGYGTLILTSMIKKACEYGLSSVWLRVSKKNERARRLYFKFDFIIESEDENELIMRHIMKTNSIK